MALCENDIACGNKLETTVLLMLFKCFQVNIYDMCHSIFTLQHYCIFAGKGTKCDLFFSFSFLLLHLSLLFQLLAVIEEWSHLGVCGTCSVCHCGEEFTKISICHFFTVPHLLLNLIDRWICIHCKLLFYSRRRPIQPFLLCHCVLDVFNLLSDFQVNIGILISVTRIISRISGENYKVHGDANAVKWVYLFSWSDQYSFSY